MNMNVPTVTCSSNLSSYSPNKSFLREEKITSSEETCICKKDYKNTSYIISQYTCWPGRKSFIMMHTISKHSNYLDTEYLTNKPS